MHSLDDAAGETMRFRSYGCCLRWRRDAIGPFQGAQDADRDALPVQIQIVHHEVNGLRRRVATRDPLGRDEARPFPIRRRVRQVTAVVGLDVSESSRPVDRAPLPGQAGRAALSHRAFVTRHDRFSGILRAGEDVQHVLHAVDVPSVNCGTPYIFPPRLQLVVR